MTAMSYSVLHTSSQSKTTVCVLKETCGHCLFLTPLKRAFPAVATDKPFCLFVFVLGWGSKHHVQTVGLWSVRIQGFIWHLHPTILITSASHSDKSDWQAAQHYLHSIYTVAVRQQILFLKQRCFVLLKDKNTLVLKGSQTSSLCYW